MKTPPAARDLAFGVAVVVAISRFAPDPFAWPIAAVVLVAAAIGALQVLADADPTSESAGVPIESVLLPALASGAAVLAIRLVPFGIVLALAVAILGALVLATLATEVRVARASGPPSSADRTAIGVQLLLVGFVAFAGAAGLIASSGAPEGLPGPADGGPTATLAVAAVDAIIGMLLGYRSAALRSSNLRDVGAYAVGAGMVMAIAAIALRSIVVPGLIGPALLVVVFFLWDAIHGGARPGRRREPWRAWETGALVVLAVAVVIWSIGIRP